MADKSIQERFWINVDSSKGPDACWPWMLSKRGKGYGQAAFQGRQQNAHRVAYVLTHGPIPKGLLVCHRCDNPPCVNPAHLFLGTHVDNARDMASKGRANMTKHSRGEAHGKSKLAESDVAAIRNDRRPQHIIAREYGISRTHVGRIRRREFWTHLA